MATHISAEKRFRESLRKQTHNRWWKSRIRTAAKLVEDAVGKKDKKLAGEKLRAAVKEIGKARAKGVIHANTASRKVSRLSLLVSKL